MSSILNWLSENRLSLIVIVLLAVAFFVLRTSPSDISAGDLQARLSGGRPVVLELYSNV